MAFDHMHSCNLDILTFVYLALSCMGSSITPDFLDRKSRKGSWELPYTFQDTRDMSVYRMEVRTVLRNNVLRVNIVGTDEWTLPDLNTIHFNFAGREYSNYQKVALVLCRIHTNDRLLQRLIYIQIFLNFVFLNFSFRVVHSFVEIHYEFCVLREFNVYVALEKFEQMRVVWHNESNFYSTSSIMLYPDSLWCVVGTSGLGLFIVANVGIVLRFSPVTSIKSMLMDHGLID